MPMRTQYGGSYATVDRARSSTGSRPRRRAFQRFESLFRFCRFVGLRKAGDQVLQHQSRLRLIAQLGEGEALLQQRCGNLITLGPFPADVVERENRLLVVLDRVVARSEERRVG